MLTANYQCSQESPTPTYFSSTGVVKDIPPKWHAVSQLWENVDVQVVVPEALKENVLEQLHNRGHLGIHKTMEKVKQCFYWPGYEDHIKSWVQNCLQCQQRNPLVPLPQAR